MKLGKEVNKRLRKNLSHHVNKTENQPEKIRFEQSVKNLRLHAVIKDFDKYSFIFEKLHLTFLRESKELNLNLRELKLCAKNLIKKVTYLLENLSLIEEEPVNVKVQLRSVFIENDKSPMSYYEIIMCGNGTVSFDRYQIIKGQKQRVSVPFNLTDEVFEKLINDISGCVSS